MERIAGHLWYNGSRTPLDLGGRTSELYCTSDITTARIYLRGRDSHVGYLNEIDLGNVAEGLFVAERDFGMLVGRTFVSAGGSRVTVTPSLERMFSHNWHWDVSARGVSGRPLIDGLLRPMGFKGFYVVERDACRAYPTVAVFPEYLSLVGVVSSLAVRY